MSLDNKVVNLADLKISHDYLLGQDELLSDRINELGSGIDGIQSQITALGNGSPIPVETVAEMTDNTKAYLYTGSEQGYTSGYWYTYDSTQAKFVPRGEYGAGVIIDSTLTVTGNAADAKATGDAIKAGKTFVVQVPGSAAVLSGSITAGDFAKAMAAYTAGSGVYAVKDSEVYQLSAASSSTMTFTQMYHGTMNFIKQIQITSADTFTVTNTALSSSATDTSYSNTASGLTATNVQEAIDENAAALSNVNGRLALQANGYATADYSVSNGGYIDTDGNIAEDTRYYYSSHISVTPEETIYVFNPHLTYSCAWYDENDAFIKRQKVDAGEPANIVVPSNAYYFAFSNMINYGGMNVARNALSRDNSERINSIETAIGDTDSKISENKSIMMIVNGKQTYILDNLTPNKYVNRTDGTLANSTSGFSATDFIYVPNNSRIVLETPEKIEWSALYDENKVYKSAVQFGPGTNTKFWSDGNCYFRISQTPEVLENVKLWIFPQVDTTLTTSGLSADAKTTGDRLASAEQRISVIESGENIPSYYTSMMETKEAEIRAHESDCSMNGDSFVFITDTHFSSDLFTSETPTDYHNSNHSLSLIKDIMKNTGTRFITFGGDLVNSADSIETMMLSISRFRYMLGDLSGKLMWTIGNHEFFTGSDYGVTVRPTYGQLYGSAVKPVENQLGEIADYVYYFDNKPQKIRYFVISCDRDTKLPTASITWLCEQFTLVPDGYRVVIIGHAILRDDMASFRYADVVGAVDALKAKTTYVYNGNTYNYANITAIVICMITGHTHIDGSLATPGGVICICTTTDAYGHNASIVDGTPTVVKRTKGTTDEQAFDVFQFDFTNKKIYCTRIGYGSDREFTYT